MRSRPKVRVPNEVERVVAKLRTQKGISIAYELVEGAKAEMAIVAEHGGAVEAVPYMKAALVESHSARLRRIESGEQTLVGVNRYTETEPSSSIRTSRRASWRRSTAGGPTAIRTR